MSGTTARRPRKSFYHRYVRPYWPVYLMLLPALVTLVVFTYTPMPGVLLAVKRVADTPGVTVGLDALLGL